MSLPDHPSKMSADWLCQILNQPAGSLRAISYTAIGTGQVGDSFRLTLDWTDIASAAPATIIAKCPAQDPTSRGTAKQLHNYEVEVRWYEHFAPYAQIRTPHCYYTQLDEDISNFVLLMEDVAPAQQGNQLSGGTPDEVRLVIDELAHLHAFRWDDPELSKIDWLNYGRGNRDFIRDFVPAIYADWRARYTGRIDETILDMGADLARRFSSYVQERETISSIVHGDCRLDNVLFNDPSGRAIVVDWQTIATGNPMADVAYLIGTSFAEPATRAACERDLVEHYLKALSQYDISHYEAAWSDYRFAAFGGFVMAVVAAMLVERTERGDEMFAVMAERSGAQAIALDSLSLL